MSETPTRRRSRMNRTGREAQPYTARANETNPNESADQSVEQPLFAAYMPSEEPEYAAYYKREGAGQPETEEPAFAPPPSMQQYAFETQAWEQEEAEGNDEASNVYHPRQVTWAEEDGEETLAEDEMGYQVQEDAMPIHRKKRHVMRWLLLSLLILALLAGAAWMMREPLCEWLGLNAVVALPTETPEAAAVTPKPIRAYDAAPAASVPDAARSSIAQLSGTLKMENYIVTEQHVITRNQRPNGSYDFYLFKADGRLLCYFEGLEALDLIPQSFGGFYVEQAPWLVKADGSALIRTADVEAAINERVFLHPMYRGWAAVESEEDGHANYVNAEGQLMGSLWFSRTFPFTGEYTLAYVDTGSTANAEDRYLLYVIGENGSMNRWLSAGHMEDAVAAVCGMAYMNDGSLYHLPDTAAPLCQSAEVTAYPDCDAMVVKDPASGKYGLFVHGEKHYDYLYDAIHPLESDLVWTEKTVGTAEASLTLKAVAGSQYPLPLSYSFVLERDGQSEYVALSGTTSYPIRLDGEF